MNGTVTADFTQIAWVGGIAGGLAVLWWLDTKARSVLRLLGRLDKVTQHELNHNGGESTKDYAKKAWEESVRTTARVNRVEQDLQAHLQAAVAQSQLLAEIARITQPTVTIQQGPIAADATHSEERP